MGAPGHSGHLNTGALIHSNQQFPYGYSRSRQYWFTDSLKPTTSIWVHQVSQATSVLVHWVTQANTINMGAPGHSGYLSTGALIHSGQQTQYGCTRSLRLPQYWCTDRLKSTISIWILQVTPVLVYWFTQANNLHMGTPGLSGYLSTGALSHSGQHYQYGCTRSLRLPQYWCIDSFRPTISIWVHQVTQATSVLVHWFT